MTDKVLSAKRKDLLTRRRDLDLMVTGQELGGKPRLLPLKTDNTLSANIFKKFLFGKSYLTTTKKNVKNPITKKSAS